MGENTDQAKTFSVMLRVQRVTYEDAYVAVPITEVAMTRKEDGTLGIDPEALVAEAIRISHDPRVEWKTESYHVEPHPMQEPKPEERQSFDAFYDQPDT